MTLVVLFCGVAFRIHAAVIHVNANQTNNVPDGASWPTAYPKVQLAIHAASNGDAVWVASGTYFENLTVTNGVELYGGFAGTETALDQRNWSVNRTILDGRQSNSVVRIIAGTNTVRLDGFVVRNGRASSGGGVYAFPGTIVNNEIVRNTATNSGGGVYGGGILVASNLIQGNVSGLSGLSGGAGIGMAMNSTARIYNNRIIANQLVGAGTGAGGIYCASGISPEFCNNAILGNSGRSGAGGIMVLVSTSPRIVNNTIAWCQGYPGGIHCDTNSSGSALIANNILAFCNSAIWGAPGITCSNNCVYGGIYIGFPDPTGTGGNISVDPQFSTNDFYPDIHLQATSPCRDAGNATVFPVGPADVDGEARVVGAAVDIGADEFSVPRPAFVPMVVRVSPAGDDGNDGSTWALAKRTVQAGVEAVTLNGGEVWVQAGTYSENIILRHFSHLYGGFNGTETNRQQRDWTANPTVLDGGQNGSVIVADHLLHWNVIDGFVIRNGRALSGAGISCDWASPVISHNVITNNTATSLANALNGWGGGIRCVNSSSVVASNTISFNQAAMGGGISCSGMRSLTQILNNRMEGNLAVRTPSAGAADGGGGGIAVFSDAFPTIAGNLLLNNVASNGLSGFAPGQGGGICIEADGGSSARVVNNTLIGNMAFNASGTTSGSYGGICNWSAMATTLIANNLVAFGSSGIMSVAGIAHPNYSLVQYNCVYGNTTNYQLIPDLTGTNGNISVDPLLVASSDYHLGANSPCINAGNNNYASAATDFDGNPRIAGGTVDIGAYEYQTPTSILSYAWLQQYGLPTDGSVDGADLDGDLLSTWQEWRAWTNPTNNLSVLSMIGASNDVSGLTVSWQSVGGVSYLLERSGDLAAPPAFSTVATNVLGQVGVTSFRDTNAIGSGPFLYRVGVR